MKKLIEMKDIVKTFPGVTAISNGKFDLIEGEIHSLIGENGAGKSSLMKILYGLYPADSGTIIVKGKEFKDFSTKEIIDEKIGMVHQEFMLVDDMTVLDNIILGFEPRKSLNRIDFKKSEIIIKEYIDNYGLDIQLNKKVKDISVGEAQRVEIIKTLYRGADILILDEPTAVLTPQETIKLFEILRKLKEDNKSIVFISHKLNEVMDISDRITIMRKSEYITTVNKEDTSERELAKLMVGREVFLNIEHKESNPGEDVLEIESVYIPGDREISKIRGLSLNVKSGEVLGLAGIDGNGQAELVEAITGLRKTEKGKIILEGKEISNLSTRKIRNLGVSLIPDDRNKRGLNRRFSIRENLIGLKYNNELSRGIFIDEKKSEEFSEKLVEDYDIRPRNVESSAEFLSGGNAQKIVVAREISSEGRLLIASQPTRGVDIGAIEMIRKKINEEKAKGKAILLISADLEEILALSDRIAVIFEGKITGELQVHEATEEKLGMLMAGGTVQ
ncbi:MAG: ABC transporter ATP-binding protein [Miniphocaeibacter sp.]|uniref:ABC transporter ATP-binding protein n=1 Tax=Miniphocaeibacter sp. TaxID=3100973 RepID=UPI0017D11CD1|nr:ABC transporter ATP-binding protein [Gallicola sp.]